MSTGQRTSGGVGLAIDTAPLAQHCMPQVQRDLDELVGNTERRFQVLSLSAHATVLHDAASTVSRLSQAHAQARGDLPAAKQEALDWQADQDEDLDELEVFHHLRQQATASPMFAHVSQTAATTLMASCAGAMSPSLAVRSQGSPLSSSFHRYSLRLSFLAFYNGTRSDFYGACSGDPTVIPQFTVKYAEWVASANFLRIVGSGYNQLCVVWHLQCDIVDLLSRKLQPSSRPGKRRRTAVNPFLQPPSVAVEKHRTSEENRYNGIRYRSNRKRWVAEMKPPRSKNKVSFGDFKSAAQAARVVDAAFYHYDRPELLNFPDSAGILSTRPSPAAALNDKDKLRFVKEESKWLASIASTLPCSSPSPSLPSSELETNTNAVVDPLRLGSSSVQIREGWDAGADDSGPVLSNFVNPSSQGSCETSTTWMSCFVSSPAVPTVPVPPSPSHFQDEVARGLLERQ